MRQSSLIGDKFTILAEVSDHEIRVVYAGELLVVHWIIMFGYCVYCIEVCIFEKG